MIDDPHKKLTEEYCPRFGKIAVDKGFITASQFKEAIAEQIEDNLAGRDHRIIGKILFDKGYITYQQIELVLEELFKSKTRNNP